MVYDCIGFDSFQLLTRILPEGKGFRYFVGKREKTSRQKEKEKSCQERLAEMNSRKGQKEGQTSDSETKRRRQFSIQIKQEVNELREKGLNHREVIQHMS